MAKKEKDRNPTQIPQTYDNMDDVIFQMELRERNLRHLYERMEWIVDSVHAEWFAAKDILRGLREVQKKSTGQQELFNDGKTG